VQLGQQSLICNVNSRNGGPTLASLELRLMRSDDQTQVIARGTASNYVLLTDTRRRWQYINQPLLGGVGTVSRGGSYSVVVQATLDRAFPSAVCFLGGSVVTSSGTVETNIQLQLSPTGSSL